VNEGYGLCFELADAYGVKKKEIKDKIDILTRFFTMNVDSEINKFESSIEGSAISEMSLGIEKEITAYNNKREELKTHEQLQFVIKMEEAMANKGEKDELQEEDQAETQEEAGSRDGPDLNITTQVPQDADMCVAVQVSGELFRIVHLTRDVETLREKKAKAEGEKEKGEEAKKTKRAQKEEKAEKAEKAEQEEIKKYDEAGYAKKMKKDKDGGKHKVRLDADYDDYRECVSAARKYLEETCIVNDTTESWSSAAWRLTKECREEASGTGGTSGTSATANFGHLEASDRLELVLVPRNLFGHVYGKGPEPKYEGKAEISKDGIWIYEDDGRGKVCAKCAVCDEVRGSNNHKEKKNTSGLFVLYNKSDKDRIRGLSSRFCFHRQVQK
jgi:hypothetical protein